MTVSSLTTSTVIASSGAGQTVFLFDFPLVNKDQINVFKDGVLESISLYTVDYTIGNQGGQIDYAVSPTTGSEIVISRDTDITQLLGFPVGGPFPSRSHEGALDKTIMIIQELLAGLNTLSARIPEGTIENSTVRWDVTTNVWKEFLTYLFPALDGLANQVLTTDGAGNIVFTTQTYIAAGITDQVLSSVSGVLTVNFQAGQSIFIELDEDITSTVITGLPVGVLCQLEFEIDQDDPVRTWVWPANTTWIGGSEVDLAVIDGKFLVRLRTRDQGSSFMATFGEDFS